MKKPRKHEKWEDITTLDRKYQHLWIKEKNGRKYIGGRGWIRLHIPEAEVLLKYCKQAKKRIVEIGHRFGGSTYLIAESSNVPVISIDKTTKNSQDFVNQFIETGQLTLIKDKSENIKLNHTYDVLFVDGDHRYEGVKKDILNFWDNLTSSGFAIFHDYLDEKDYIDDAMKENVAVAKAVDELLISTKKCKVIERSMSLLVVQKV